MISLLLASGANTEARDKVGSKENWMAFVCSRLVDSLLSQKGQTPLHAAMILGSAPVAELLVAAGALLNATDQVRQGLACTLAN